jgi:hypothetical protein
VARNVDYDNRNNMVVLSKNKVILVSIFLVLVALTFVFFLISKDRLSNDQDTVVSFSGKKPEGEFKNGLANGKRTKAFPDGTIYTGEFKDGQASGTGTITYPKGIIYEGEVKNGKPHGQGTITYNGGLKQVGEFKDGLANGKGTLIAPNGTIFTGSWKDGGRHGEFIETTPEGEHRVRYWFYDRDIGEEKPAAIKSYEAECAEMLKKGELKKGMNVESCVRVLYKN